jgi:hypothetical protein
MMPILPTVPDTRDKVGLSPCLCEPFSDVLENFPEGAVRDSCPLRRKARNTGHHHNTVDHHNPVQGFSPDAFFWHHPHNTCTLLPEQAVPDFLTGIPENVYVKLYGRYFNLCLLSNTLVSGPLTESSPIRARCPQAYEWNNSILPLQISARGGPERRGFPL